MLIIAWASPPELSTGICIDNITATLFYLFTWFL